MLSFTLNKQRFKVYDKIEQLPFSKFLEVCGLDKPDELRDYYKIGLSTSDKEDQLKEWSEAYKDSDGIAITNYQLNLLVTLTPNLSREQAKQARLSDIRALYQQHLYKIAQLVITWPFFDGVQDIDTVKVGGKNHYLPSSKLIHTGEKVLMGEATFEEYTDVAHLMSTSDDLERLPLQVAMLLRGSPDEKYNVEQAQDRVDAVKQMLTSDAANVAFFLLKQKINCLTYSALYSAGVVD